jgi:competence protein ComEA
MIRVGLIGMAAVALVACAPFRRQGPAAPPAAIDLNTAPLRKIEDLPGITPRMARRIVEGRPYTEPRDLVERGILTERELDRILDRATVEPRR